ncbi:hypothetical protein GC207_13530 [bacterium]|nr:hypothetical protein [bacterium]
MNNLTFSLFAFGLLTTATVNAQLAATLSPIKSAGQKAVVPLALKNEFKEKIETARAVCFLLDDQGKVVGQSTRWIIGGKKSRPPMKPNSTNTFNFVVSLATPHPSTNLTATVKVTRLVLEHGRTVDPNREVIIKPAEK